MQISFLANRIRPQERSRFALLAMLLLLNSVVLESNEVLATGGFASQVGAEFLPWLWAADMFIVMTTSAIYSLLIDRWDRNQITIGVLVSLAVAYLLLYVAFVVPLPYWITYSAFMIITDQQWLLVPLLVWALANDAFSTAVSKRLVPLLGIAVLVGQLTGNALAAIAASIFTPTQLATSNLLLTNASVLLFIALLYRLSSQVIHINARRAGAAANSLENLREGIEFIIAVPAYRFLAITMILMGFGLNVIEFHFIMRVADTYVTLADLQVFYGIFKFVSITLLAIIQGWVVTQLINRLGFERIFGCMPVTITGGLMLALAWPGIFGVALGNLFTRVTLLGIDEPARHAFQGLVPDERRGRVSAVMDGYLYPIGAILSCAMLLAILALVHADYFTRTTAQEIYLSIALLCTGSALFAIVRMNATYEKSMLNWRLQRKRRSSQLDNLDF